VKFLVITSAPTFYENGMYFAYAPYVKEMNLWFKNVEQITIVSPTRYSKPLLKDSFSSKNIEVVSIPALNISSIWNVIKFCALASFIFFKICTAMWRADHIHLRCPGNIGLLGCIAQVFFPKKRKTAKYAGNWDPEAKQPWSYRLQKYILSNEKLTKNMTVLVYGEWPGQSKNCKSFFTATYSENQQLTVKQRKYDLPLRFLFVGSLVKGKRPLYALRLVHELIKNEIPSELHVYGDGPFHEKMRRYIQENDLDQFVYLYGNKDFYSVEQAYRKSHFLMLASKSEGWPKVVAEAMWWGVLPIVTRISCVPWMLAEGSRGILIQGFLKKDIKKLINELNNKNALRTKSNKAQLWSRKYTVELFESEIKKLL
jgi:glycosyltransferase involved in cell wall biosynthesis